MSSRSQAKAHVRPSGRALSAVLAGLAILTMASCKGRQAPQELPVAVSLSGDSIPRYSILELTFAHGGSYKNNFLDVRVSATFRSPQGTQHHIRGFYYGGTLWKIRFRPDEPGHWTYTYLFATDERSLQQGAGRFECRSSEMEGPIRRNPHNPYRWVLADGKPYFPVGLEDCVGVHGAELSDPAIDGEARTGPRRRLSWEEYFSVYGQAGFNLFRFSQKNCSYSLLDDLDHYRVAEGGATDRLLSSARENGLRVMFGFFGVHGNWSSDNRVLRVLKRSLLGRLLAPQEAILTPDDQATIAKEKRFIDYCIARWGVYADFWELLNERQASDKWTTLMADYVHSVDPDHRPVSTSWEKPDLSAIDINAPHWYESENELDSDLRVQQQAAKWKQAGKPVIVGEQGNTGMNWDSLSARRMRIRAWTALFEEISLIFWNTSWSREGMFGGRYSPRWPANIYLGPEERKYIRVLTSFSLRLDANVRMVPVEVSSSSLVRAYGLLSDRVAGVYLVHANDHTSLVRDAKVSLNLPGVSRSKLVGEWLDPATGEVVAPFKVASGHCTLQAPAFQIDLALLIRPPGDYRLPGGNSSRSGSGRLRSPSMENKVP